MRIKYVCLCCDDQKSGVNKKILSQIEHLARNGVDVVGYSLCEYREFDTPHTHVNHVHITGLQKTSTVIQKLKRDYLYIESIRDIIDSSKEDDVIYLRHRFPFLKFLRLLQQPRNCKVVLEFQTIDAIEARLLGLYWYVIVDRLFGTAIRRSVDAFVGVTDEITRYQLSRTKDPNKAHITIGNGFDVQSVPLRNVPVYDGKELHLLCIATVSLWHGIDRLLHGMSLYKGPTNITVHIVGKGQMEYLRELSIELNLHNNVFFHEYAIGEELDGHFNRCHIGVGSLAIHRKGLQETSELKGREYCARGIPYINAAKDSDYPADFPYRLMIAPDESPISMDDILSFAQTTLVDPDHPKRMRRYAEEYLDWSVKTKRLKDFLEELVDKRR